LPNYFLRVLDKGKVLGVEIIGGHLIRCPTTCHKHLMLKVWAEGKRQVVKTWRIEGDAVKFGLGLKRLSIVY
jgi:hypothetical protein